MLREIGLDRVRMVRTNGGPIVLGESRRSGPGPCLLIYGHYDVVPAGPRAAWRTPPFTATVSDGFTYGRGACDDKGPLMCHLAALRAWLSDGDRPPIDVVCMLDGEEEVGSPGLRAFLQRAGRGLGATVAVVSDTRTLGPDRPTLITGLRGGLVCRLRLTGPARNLHSGQYGGAIHDPAEALADLVASLHDERGRVTVPGFYDGVRIPSPAERARLRRVAPSDRALLATAGAGHGHGEAGWSAFERTTLRPALSVSQISSGERGSDSVIPATAEATISLRLVSDQTPARIAEQLQRALIARTPPTVGIQLVTRKLTRPWRIAGTSPALRAASRALAASFPHPPVALPSGGTVSVVPELAGLGIPVILMGFARPDDGMHGPNERADLTLLDRGAAACTRLLAELAASPGTPAPERAVAVLAR
jgi:acetylornithine deacetylase/succinyl-diaminopimelate desuccinylase-like protein